MGDRRLANDQAINAARQQLLAALLTGRNVAYAVDHNGHSYTAIGFRRDDGVVPLALFLTDDDWQETPHRTKELYAAKQPPLKWN